MAVSEADAQGLWMTHAEIMRMLRQEDLFSLHALDAAHAAGKTGKSWAIGKNVGVSSHGELPQSGGCLEPGIRPVVAASIPVVWFFTKLTKTQMLTAENQMTKDRRARDDQEIEIMTHNRMAALAMAEKSCAAGAESGSLMRW